MMFASMIDTTRANIERKIAAARLALAFEALWAALCWPLIWGAMLAAVMLSGLLPYLPDMARYGVLAVLLGVTLWSLRAVWMINWPNSHDAMRRIEARSTLLNRPLSTRDDSLAEADHDPASEVIWQEHKHRQLAALGDLKVGKPQSAWPSLDPLSLRVPASMALIASLFLAQGDGLSNFKSALHVGPAVAQKTISLDAWLKPPAYTGKPPLLLTSPAVIEKLKTDGQILVPENAGLTIRLDGAKAPSLHFYDVTPDAATEVRDQTVNTKFSNGLFEAETRLARPSVVKVFDGDKELASWHISLVPDQPPTIAILGNPDAKNLGSMAFKWKATDDYGVSGITSQIYLSDTQEDGVGFTNNGVFLFDPPNLPIALRKSAPKEEVGVTNADLSAHPWAGLMVDLTLEVTDAAKHTTTSETKTFKLPERFFSRPLARALIEQRKILIMDPDRSGDVEKLLSAILIYPDGLIESSGPHLAIAAIISRLQNMGDRSDLEVAIDMLWQVAINIEEGELSDARADVEAARKALETAIAQGASPEQLKQLMSKLREAMDHYMKSMKDEAQKRQAEGQGNKNRSNQNSKQITEQDLQKMLDAIDKLTQNGAKDAAQEMLSQLEDILKNLEPGTAQKGDPKDQSATTEMLNQLSDLMRKQQDLMDQTQRQQQQGNGDPLNQQGDDPGNSNGGERGSSGDWDNLSQRQLKLGQQLDELLRGLGQNGLPSPDSLKDAGKQMGDAQKSLEQQQQEQALNQQGEALKQLRDGAQDMARQMQQQSQGNQNNTGQDGEAKGNPRDPLGRPMPSGNDQYGPDKNMLPSELAIRRAREILENLRGRANAPDLPRIDRDYIERLLRGLY